MGKLRTLIIDDEAPARTLVESYLKDHDKVEVSGSFKNGFEGLKAIQELKPDLVILDVQMPKITGFEMLELIEKPPIVIFSTAYDQFAIKAFEMNATDYLLKPYSKDRLLQAIDKACSKMLEDQKTNIKELNSYIYSDGNYLERIVVKTGNRINVITQDNIEYLEAQDDYVEIVTSGGRFLKQNTMKFYEDHLDPQRFVRIHRSFIVAVRQIDKLELMGKENYVLVLKSGGRLKVSKSGYSRLKSILDF